MPYQKLIVMEKFSDLRLKQLWDDCRIFVAWFSSIKHGKKIVDQKTGQKLTLLDCVKRYARARGLLMALGYEIGPKRLAEVKGKNIDWRKKFKPSIKSTPEFKEMFKLALPSIKYYFRLYKNRVERS